MQLLHVIGMTGIVSLTVGVAALALHFLFRNCSRPETQNIHPEPPHALNPVGTLNLKSPSLSLQTGSSKYKPRQEGEIY